MNKKTMRLAILFLAFGLACQTVPVQAWWPFPVPQVSIPTIPQSARTLDTIAKPLAIAGIAGTALAGSLWLAKKLFTAHNTQPTPGQTFSIPVLQFPTIQFRESNDPVIPCEPQAFPHIITLQGAMPKPQTTLTDPQNPAPSLPQFSIASSQGADPAQQMTGSEPQNPAPEAPQYPAPTYSIEDLINLGKQIEAVPEGYKPATDEQVAIVPYFNDENNLIDKPFHFENPDDHARVIVLQVKVARQEGAACGLHSTKNDAALAGLIRGHNTAIMLTDDYASELLIENLQQEIIQTQKKRALRDILVSHVLHKPEHTPDEEHAGWLTDRYAFMLEHFFDEQLDRIERDKEVIISEQDIYNYLAKQELPQDVMQRLQQEELERVAHEREQLDKATSDHNERKIAECQAEINRNYHKEAIMSFNSRPIARYVHVENPIHITQVNLDGAIEQYNKNRIFGHKDSQDGEIDDGLDMENNIRADGENAAVYDLSPLVEAVRRQPNSPFAIALGNVPITFVSQANSPACTPTLYDLRNNIFAHSMPEQRVHLFICGNGGHWIALACEFSQGERRWTIADSVNINGQFYGLAADVIRYVEGKNAGNLLKPSQECIDRASQTLKDCLISCENDEQENSDELQHALHNYLNLKGQLSELTEPDMAQRINEQIMRLTLLASTDEESTEEV